MDYFKLTRSFWDYAFENPEKIKPNHCALYLFIVEHCNRLGWKNKFGLPTTMTKDAIGIRSYNTYIQTLNDLVDFGLIELIEKSKNQYSSNIIALSDFNKAPNKALDKALIKHDTKQSESTVQSIDSIDKQDTILPITIETINTPTPEFLNLWSEYKNYRVAKNKKFKYAGLQYEQIAFDKFYKLANGNIDIAKKILEQSISSNWDGLFILKDNQEPVKKVAPVGYYYNKEGVLKRIIS